MKEKHISKRLFWEVNLKFEALNIFKVLKI
jgi:hypothetical protein